MMWYPAGRADDLSRSDIAIDGAANKGDTLANEYRRSANISSVAGLSQHNPRFAGKAELSTERTGKFSVMYWTRWVERAARGTGKGHFSHCRQASAALHLDRKPPDTFVLKVVLGQEVVTFRKAVNGLSIGSRACGASTSRMPIFLGLVSCIAKFQRLLVVTCAHANTLPRIGQRFVTPVLSP